MHQTPANRHSGWDNVSPLAIDTLRKAISMNTLFKWFSDGASRFLPDQLSCRTVKLRKCRCQFLAKGAALNDISCALNRIRPPVAGANLSNELSMATAKGN